MAALTGPENAARREELFREALATLRQSLPPRKHVMTTDVLLAYGRFLSDAGRTAEAEPLLREAYDARRRTLGDRTSAPPKRRRSSAAAS